MEDKDHIYGVGRIVLNLQALESVLRAFLVERYDQCPKFPEPGDTVACRNYLTTFISLGGLIKDYNRSLPDGEAKYIVDGAVVIVRDALAHGRLFSRGEAKPPFELWKFGSAKEGKMPVEFFERLTTDWLVEKSNLIDAQRAKVVDCAKALGYKRLS